MWRKLNSAQRTALRCCKPLCLYFEKIIQKTAWGKALSAEEAQERAADMVLLLYQGLQDKNVVSFLQRQCFLHFYGMYTPPLELPEIARKFRISEKKAAKYLLQAKEAMKEFMNKQELFQQSPLYAPEPEPEDKA